EVVVTVVVRQAPAHSGEVRIERCRMLIPLVDIAPARVGLPDFYELPAPPPPVAVDDSTGHDRPFADRGTVVLDRQVGFERVHVTRAGARRPQLDPLRAALLE